MKKQKQKLTRKLHKKLVFALADLDKVLTGIFDATDKAVTKQLPILKHLHQNKNLPVLGTRSGNTQLLVFLLVLNAAFGLVAAVQPKPVQAAPTTANLWVDPSGGSCTRQATAGAYNDSQACGSFDAAWDAASNGDTIVVKAATYSPQLISGNKTVETKIIGEDGTRVAGVMECMPAFGSDGAFCANANFMTLENVTIDALDNQNVSSGSQINGSNVTYKNVNLYGDYVSISIDGPNFTWQKGSHGQDGIDGLPRTCEFSAGEPVWVFAANATLDGIRFNPKKIQSGGVNNYCGADVTPHLETIRTESGATNLTIKNSWFVAGSDAGSGHLFTSTGAPGLKLLNNVFDPVNGSYSIQAGNACDWTVAYNTFTQGMSLTCDSGTWVGNLGVATPGCGGTHTKNVWQGTGSCGTDTFIGSTSLGLGTGGHLLAGSPAIDSGETDSASDFCTGALGSVDIDGNLRPSGAACDAGADEFASPASVFLSASGNDSNPCTQSLRCKSFDRAYKVAASGGIVEVATGTYGDQTIARDATKTSGNDVVFQPASGATVTVGDITSYASHITYKDMTARDMLIRVTDPPTGTVDDISLINLDARNFLIYSATNVNIIGGDYGPASDCGGPYGGSNNSIRQYPGAAQPSNIVIDGIRIHDIQTYDAGPCHMEGLAIFAGSNITVKNSKFYQNSIYDIFLQPNSGAISGITIENNWFAATTGQQYTGSGASAVAFSGSSSDFANTTIRHNSFNDMLSLDDNGVSPSYSNFKVIGNIGDLGFGACSLSVTFSYNLWKNEACNGTDVNLNSAAYPYVNTANDLNLNYHLSGTGGLALNRVPTATSGLSTDIDSNTRPQGSANEAGSDEISGAGGGGGDTTAPTVSMSAPANGATVSGTTATVSATASDAVGVVGVQFKLDGANLNSEDTSSPYSISWNTTAVANGSHTLAAVARDAAGNTTTATAVTVTVSNVAGAPTYNAPLYRLYSPYTNDHFLTASSAERDAAIGGGYRLESVTSYISSASGASLVALNRLYSPYTGKHFYTTSTAEKNSAVSSGFISEGVAGYISNTSGTGLTPLYRVYSPSQGKHFYTPNLAEKNYLVSSVGYKDEGTAGYVASAATSGKIPVYRLYSPYTNDHLLTANVNEAAAAANIGFRLETVAGYANTSSGTGLTAFYRLYSTKTGKHFYTTSSSERTNAINNLGFKDEGTTAYISNTSGTGLTPLYRVYSPSQGKHFYTPNLAERDYLVSKAGYTAEGTAGYIGVSP